MTVSVKVAKGQEIKGLRCDGRDSCLSYLLTFFVKLYVEFFLKTEHLSVFNLTNPSYLQTSIYQFFLKNLIILYPNIQKKQGKTHAFRTIFHVKPTQTCRAHNKTDKKNDTNVITILTRLTILTTLTQPTAPTTLTAALSPLLLNHKHKKSEDEHAPTFA